MADGRENVVAGTSCQSEKEILKKQSRVDLNRVRPYICIEIPRTCVYSQVDCYSYGVLLWELVTKEPPQRGNLRDIQPHECASKILLYRR